MSVLLLLLHCFIFMLVLLYCCYVMYPDHHFTVIYLQTCVPCVVCVFLVITSTLFNLYLVLLLCCVYRSSLVLLLCYVLFLFLYCCYVVYTDHHFTVIYLQTCVLCVCLVITSTLFYLYTCTVVMLCIQIITLL